MGNQARQRQELELWQIVTPSESNKRQARQQKTVRIEAVRNVEPARRPNPRAAEPIRRTNSRAAEPARRTAPKTAELVRRATPRNRAQALARQKARRRRTLIYRCLAIVWVMVLIFTVMFLGKVLYDNFLSDDFNVKAENDENAKPVLDGISIFGDDSDVKKPEIQEEFLTISEYNRPGTRLARVNNIFVHYTANPGTSAAQNRSYFESLGQTHERAASAHFIIGYEGEIIQCIPLEEEAYAVVDRNDDSISIECCFIEDDGSFTQETYDSLIALLAWLTDKYDLEPEDILRHYDCGGKLCPIYYVEHEDEWERLLYDVKHYKL